MANYAFLSLWFREFTIASGLTHLEKVLSHFPVSAQQPGLRLVVRSLDPGQSPSLEVDLLATPADVRAAAAEFLHDDTAYEVTAYCDLWQPRAEGAWEQAPMPVEFLLAGEEFDAARYREVGHLQANLGPETLYLQVMPSPTPSEAGPSLRFARENVRRLFAFLRSLEKELPLADLPAGELGQAGWRLWSEGDPDFSVRSEQLLFGTAAPPTQDPRP